MSGIFKAAGSLANINFRLKPNIQIQVKVIQMTDYKSLFCLCFQGDLIGGVASDAFGRRHTLMVICIIHMIAAYSAIFVRNYWLFIFVRLFIGGTAHAAWSILVSIHAIINMSTGV